MTTTQKAIILGLVTEAVGASFVVIDMHMGIAAATQAVSLTAIVMHFPAVIVLSILDALFEAILGLSGGKPAFFDGFGTGRPAWSLICMTQAMIWIGFWAAAFTFNRYIRGRFSHVRH